MFLQQVGNFRVPKDKKTSQKNCTTPLFLIQGTAKEYIDPTLTASIPLPKLLVFNHGYLSPSTCLLQGSHKGNSERSANNF